MEINKIREKYFEHFKEQKHKIIPSASLLPENDPTTLFTSSGMQPLVPYFLGEKHPEGKRLVNSQKCIRAGDIEEVGDNRHTTFFEMLGNWSLGDYFKKEQIPWVFSFLTEKLELDPARIYVTVFSGNESLSIPRDEESVALWQNSFKEKEVDAIAVEDSDTKGMQDGRIFYYDETKNWWSRAGVPSKMAEGEPGGPDTEMFWDFGKELGIHESSEWKDSPCHVNCDCGRFVEIGNSVFMEYIKKDGVFEKLPKQNVDFGGGLERLAAAIIDSPDIFKIDVFAEPLKKLEEFTKKKYDELIDSEKEAFRVILDHIRAATFLIADGAIPSNKDQGYVTRRLVRRATRFGKNLGTKESVTAYIAESFISTYQKHYTNINERKGVILTAIAEEEKKFLKTLSQGQKYFDKLIKKGKTISGTDAYILYTTYGFPIEITEELAKEEGGSVDMKAFEKEMKGHQQLSKAGGEKKFKGGLQDTSYETTQLHTATHLLHAALRKVLGDHVFQKGSNITQERLRFDFSHTAKMSDKEKEKVESIVNDAIKSNYDMVKEEMTTEEAKQKGAIGLFEDEYARIGNKISLYTAMDSKSGNVFSREICGGPHVKKTGELGQFKIKKEEAVSAGVRRIKAIIE